MCLISNYSETKDKGFLSVKTINVSESPDHAFKRILKYLEDNNYDDLKSSLDYYDIYCYDYGYEISINILKNIESMSSSIKISVYKTKVFQHAKHHLKKFKKEIINLFQNSIIE